VFYERQQPAHQPTMWRCLGIVLLDASLEVLDPSFPESPESDLGVCCTLSTDGLVF
jgi:hypothetical protein